ncbi:unnamed protein product [Urochloa decumbens]|uniref:Pre-rRNA-processing protein TSR2 n=1 Tax=Urochloa decumbens TaxID=240449 RepID=A0ABC8WCN7_9POAL
MASSSSSSAAGTAASDGALSGEGLAAMEECIGFLFGQWAALQMAVRNRWGGGGNAQAKADQLAASVLAWFTRAAKGAGLPDQDELEDLLCDAMDEYFHADLEDGSIEEVAKHLMITYTRCLRQNYSYINKLRKTRLAGSAITQSKKIMRYGGSESSDDEEEEEEEEIPIDVEAPRNRRPPKPIPDADGWTTVPTRRGRK